MNYKSSTQNSNELIDNYRHRGLRQKMINELRRKGITDEKVLHAMSIIPRHYMLDKAFEEWAYKDLAFRIEAEQTISMPYTVALQSQLLDIRSNDKVLEVGTGSGYQAAVLYVMGAKVYTIERQKTLFQTTATLLNRMNLHRIRTLYGDGFKGAPRFAPFDKIIVTAGASDFPQNLIDQLTPGGFMILPFGAHGKQEMMRYTKLKNGTLKKQNYGPCAFVPMLNGVMQ